MRSVAATAFVSAVALLAQSPGDAPVIRTTTRLVQVSVIVHDRNGPVADLKQEDFALFDRGKRRQIAFFSVDTSRKTIAGEPSLLPKNVFINGVVRRANTPTSITILLLDGLNTPIADQMYARRHVKKFLTTLGAHDRVAIYTLGRTLRVLHDFTSEPAELERAMARYRGRSDSTLETMPHEPIQTGDSEWDQVLENALQNFADRLQIDRVRQTTQAIEAIANHIAPLPGRKNLVWISGSFPFSIGMDEMSWSNPTAERRTFNEEITRATRAVNNANLAIYPVDARGLMVDPTFQAERPMSIVAARAQPPRMWSPPGHDTMQELASRTGGRAFYNTNDIAGAVRRALDDTEVTYTLGFYPASEDIDGRYHELKIAIPTRKGLDVRFRRGYLADDREAPPKKGAKSELHHALWSPLELNGISLAAKAERLREKDGESLRLVLVCMPQQFSLAQQGGRWRGVVDYLIAQLDREGKLLKPTYETVTLNLTNESYQKALNGGFRFTKGLKPEPEAVQLRAIFIDRVSGATGSLIIPISRIETAAAQP